MKMPLKEYCINLAVCLLAACEPLSSANPFASDGDILSNQENFVVHEWGTFTSVVSSVGDTLEGLHHEEEALPGFVYGRAALTSSRDVHCAQGDTKCTDTPPGGFSGVTQKLETPVIYFYGQGIEAATVHVDFPEGLISQWYPNASQYSPPPGAVPIRQGSMAWEIELIPGLREFPEVAPDDIWAPSRAVPSIPVRVGRDQEQFIFYRGLGSFVLPKFKVSAHDDNTVSLQNNSGEAIANVFMLYIHKGGGAIKELGVLKAGEQLAHIVPPTSGKEDNLDSYVEAAKQQVSASLQEAGLTVLEAQAMVNTWSKSYFRTLGLRFLYVVPRAWIDRLLPLRITPEPSDLVRVFVGRIEVLTPNIEQQTLSVVKDSFARLSLSSVPAATPTINELGRFAEPKLRRTCAMISDNALQSYCLDLVEIANKSP